MDPCPFKEFEGKTQKDLTMYTLYIQKQLEKCDLKQQQELIWFDNLEKALDSRR